MQDEIKNRVARGDVNKFNEILSKVPSAPPHSGDAIDTVTSRAKVISLESGKLVMEIPDNLVKMLGLKGEDVVDWETDFFDHSIWIKIVRECENM